MAKYRIGIASSDGIVVNQHFGRARQFIIIDVEENGDTSIVEQREVCPVCEGGVHDDNRLEEAVRHLTDCNYILVSRIGQGASYALERQGIAVFELPGLIEDSIKKLIAYIEIQNLLQ